VDRFSTRLAGSIIADRHREASIARRACATATASDLANTRGPATIAQRIVQQLGRPFGLRPAR
jgi:hypothetical protein